MWIWQIESPGPDGAGEVALDDLYRPPPRRRRFRPLWRWLRRRWRRVVLVVLVLVVVAAGLDAALVWRRIDKIDVEVQGSPPGGTTFLLVGSDSREYFGSERDFGQFGTVEDNPGERADVVLAVRVRDDGSTSLLKLPRDLLVMDETYSPQRLASALVEGDQALVDTLCRSLGLAVDHYVLVRLPGLRSIIDELGGFEVTVDHPTRDPVTGLRLDEGTTLLDGNETLSYIGARNLEVQIDGEWVPQTAGDDRASHAAAVLTVLGQQLDVSWRHPIDAHRRLWVLLGGVSADNGLGPFDALALRSALAGLKDAGELSLPGITTPGDIPTDELTDDAGKVLAEFDGPEPSSKCEPHLRQATLR